MGLFTTPNQDELYAEMDAMCETSHKLYGSHSYIAGYYGSTISQLFAHLPKKKQREFIDQIKRSHSKLALQLEEKSGEKVG